MIPSAGGTTYATAATAISTNGRSYRWGSATDTVPAWISSPPRRRQGCLDPAPDVMPPGSRRARARAEVVGVNGSDEYRSFVGQLPGQHSG